jgi:hypothetical protein
MNRNRIPKACAGIAAFAVGLTVLNVPAERILYLDAAAPGALPNLFWTDLTTNEHDFIASGNAGFSPPVYVDNPGSDNDYYDLELNNGFAGIGDESLFDFDTEVAGAGLGTPFSIHVYFRRTGFLGGGNTGETLVTKAEEGTAGQFAGWMFSANGDNAQRADVYMQVGNNVDRLFHRIQDNANHPSGFTDNDVMMTMTHDGSGTLAGTKQYVNGIDQAITWSLDALGNNPVGSSMTNESPLRIGWTDVFGSSENVGTDANLYFVEVHDTVLTQGEVTTRWNSGNPTRETVSPDRPSILIKSIGPTNDTGLSFSSVTGRTYELQSTVETNSPSWISTGLNQDGTGGNMTLVDPSGFDTGKTYRVIFK